MFFDKRNKMARDLVKEGSSNLLDIISINYGEWPLRGLDIVTSDHLKKKEVLLRPMTARLREAFSPWGSKTEKLSSLYGEFKLLAFAGGLAGLGTGFVGPHESPSDIWINKYLLALHAPLFSDTSFNPVLAHERRHIQQEAIPCALVHYDREFESAMDRHFADRVFDRLKFYPTEPKQGISGILETFLSVAETVTAIGFGRMSYLQRGHEVQARLETLLVQGYPKWPHMPLSKEELWVAMIDSGLRPPKEFRKELAQNPAFIQAQKTFQIKNPDRIEKARNLLTTTQHQINLAVRNLPSKEAQADFWRDGLPKMYGDILESFGDRQGRARMGLGRNPQLPYLLFGKEIDALVLGQGEQDTWAIESIRNKKTFLSKEELSVFTDDFETRLTAMKKSGTFLSEYRKDGERGFDLFIQTLKERDAQPAPTAALGHHSSPPIKDAPSARGTIRSRADLRKLGAAGGSTASGRATQENPQQEGEGALKTRPAGAERVLSKGPGF